MQAYSNICFDVIKCVQIRGEEGTPFSESHFAPHCIEREQLHNQRNSNAGNDRSEWSKHKIKGSNSSVLLHLQLESCNVCSQLMLQCAHTARLKVGSLPRPSHLRFDVMAVKKFDAPGGRGAPQNLGLFCYDEPLAKICI